ncbi:MAG: protein phosphatase CheZ [Oxalobacter sp.]|nr:MAG: protein phosphatase CheZ [Oxalobacter sp.]
MTTDKTASADPLAHPESVLVRVGQLTRALHDSLRGLGLDKLIEKAAHEIPNVKDRLDYVTKMSEQAAQRVLNATDIAGPLQDKIEEGGEDIRKEWQKALDGMYSDKQYRALAEATIQYLDGTREASVETRKLLLEIMMAQDFQDLTGQVIKKISDLVTNMEQQLVQLLIDYAPTELKREVSSGLLNGPQINPSLSADVVASQGQVDDLLESLGF